ncbi:hypothetical protein HDU67_000744 [Dinochytrium kinnereticum]|nr:hypothetical protein HDU67_000744 [Dinochytrium kinnereticum]
MALPYIDHELNDERYKQFVDEAIKQEMAAGKPPAIDADDYSLFAADDLLQQELARVARGESLVAIDTARFRLEPPKGTSMENPSVNWGKAVDNALAQLEHKHNQMLNLELMNKFGSNAWRLHNHHLDSLISKLQQELEVQKQALLEINKDRKTDQIRVGFTLSALETRWAHLVDQCLRVDIACEMLEVETNTL